MSAHDEDANELTWGNYDSATRDAHRNHLIHLLQKFNRPKPTDFIRNKFRETYPHVTDEEIRICHTEHVRRTDFPSEELQKWRRL
jgi:hypothetical protein